MKKIKTVKQLNAEKNRLLNRRHELENAIHYDWIDLKDNISPKKLTKSIFEKNSSTDDNDTSKSIFTDTLSKLAGRFTEKMAEKTEAKIHKWLGK